MDNIDFSNDVIERLLFKQMLIDKRYMNICSSIFDKRWIQTEHLAKIMQMSINYYKKYNSIPNTKLVKALAKKYAETVDVNLADVNALIDNCVTLDIGASEEVLGKNLKEFIRKKALWTSIIDNVEDIEKNSENVLDKCLERFDAVNKITFNDQDLGMNFFSEDGMKKHWDFINNPEDKIKTGWQSIDKYTNGGFLKDGRMLALFVAQAGLGKSLFMSNLAVNCLRNDLKVVVISLEMSQDVYAQRFDAHISEDDVNHLKESQENSIQKIKNFYAAHPNANLFIKEYPPRSIRCADIETYLDNLKMNGHDFDIVFVDYLNLILPNKGQSDNMFKDGLEVSERLRALSYKFNVPIVSATQCNTSGYNSEELGMENISESRGIAHTADVIMGLFQTQEDREAGLLHCRMLKNRLGGQIGQCATFTMNPSNLVLSDITFDVGSNTTSISTEADNILGNMKNIAMEI